MEMTALLLVSAVAVLIGPGAANPVHHLHNLDQIIDLVNNYSAILTREYFVEDVTDLADAGCEDAFFCKVHDILISHGKKEDEKIRRNLDVYIKNKPVNCEEALKKVTKTEIKRPMPKLLENLKTCIQRKNFRSGTMKHNA